MHIANAFAVFPDQTWGIDACQSRVGGVHAQEHVFRVRIGHVQINGILMEQGGIGMGVHAGLYSGFLAGLADLIGEGRVGKDGLLVEGALERRILPHHTLHVHIVSSYGLHEFQIAQRLLVVFFGIIAEVEVQVFKLQAVLIHHLLEALDIVGIVVGDPVEVLGGLIAQVGNIPEVALEVFLMAFVDGIPVIKFVGDPGPASVSDFHK